MSKIPDFEPREPVGTYQVWHKESDGFRHVANVEGGNLLAAIVLPYINKDEAEYRRVTPLVDDARTITYGDVIVNPEHVAFEIYKEADFGLLAWRQIDFAKEQFKVILERDSGETHEEFLRVSTERALARMEGKEKEGRER
jgi:hypothetical protein